MTKTVDHIISQTREILIEGWITVNGARILIDDDTGEVEGGPKGLRGKVFKDAESKPLDQLQAEKDPHAGRVRVDKAPGDRLGGALYRHTLNVEKWTQRGDKEETIKAHRSAARAFRKEAESERRKGFEKDAKDLERAASYHERMEARFKAEAEGKEPKGPEPTKPEIVKQVEQEAKAEVPQPSTSRPIADLATPIGSTELEKSAARILQAHKANQEADKLANDDYASRRQSPGETFNQTRAWLDARRGDLSKEYYDRETRKLSSPGEFKREDIISKAKVKAAPEGSNKLQVAETSEFSDLLSDTEVMKLRDDGIVSAKESGFKGFQRLITLVRQGSSETLTLSALREELGTRNTRRRPMTVGKR